MRSANLVCDVNNYAYDKLAYNNLCTKSGTDRDILNRDLCQAGIDGSPVGMRVLYNYNIDSQTPKSITVYRADTTNGIKRKPSYFNTLGQVIDDSRSSIAGALSNGRYATGGYYNYSFSRIIALFKYANRDDCTITLGTVNLNTITVDVDITYSINTDTERKQDSFRVNIPLNNILCTDYVREFVDQAFKEHLVLDGKIDTSTIVVIHERLGLYRGVVLPVYDFKKTVLHDKLNDGCSNRAPFKKDGEIICPEASLCNTHIVCDPVEIEAARFLVLLMTGDECLRQKALRWVNQIPSCMRTQLNGDSPLLASMRNIHNSEFPKRQYKHNQDIYCYDYDLIYENEMSMRLAYSDVKDNNRLFPYVAVNKLNMNTIGNFLQQLQPRFFKNFDLFMRLCNDMGIVLEE